MADRTSRLRKKLEVEPFDIPARLTLIDMLEQSGRSTEAQLQRILMEPDSDEHRAAFAALCSESGEPAVRRFGVFINRQLEFAKEPHPGEYRTTLHNNRYAKLSKLERGSPTVNDQILQEITAQHAVYFRWFYDWRKHIEQTARSCATAVLDYGRPGKHAVGTGVLEHSGGPHDVTIGDDRCLFLVKRGFPRGVVVDWHHWTNSADLIMGRHPITAVHILNCPFADTDRVSFKLYANDRYEQFGSRSCHLHARLYDHLYSYYRYRDPLMPPWDGSINPRFHIRHASREELITHGLKQAWPQVSEWSVA